jgi:hypothetical protein
LVNGRSEERRNDRKDIEMRKLIATELDWIGTVATSGSLGTCVGSFLNSAGRRDGQDEVGQPRRVPNV